MKEIHPLTRFIPETADEGALSMDIAQSGPREPVILYEGKIIEGRVRYRCCQEVDVQPQFTNWVLIADGDPLDWMVKRHVEQHEPDELALVRLVVAVLPYYRELKGSTHKRLYEATGLPWNKIRTLDWLEQASQVDKVLLGELDVYEAGRKYGFIADRRELSFGNFGSGDKFDEASIPLQKYLAAWGRKKYEFRHINPKEANRRLQIIDRLVEELTAARVDLEKRSHVATLSAPPERKERR